jgi:hypothetical protein
MVTMRGGFLTLALLAVSSATATAQTIVFQDGFENGFAQWTATGLWNATLPTLPCFSPSNPFPEGTTAAWYGIPTSCDYQTGTAPNSGRLELTTWIQLPTNAASVTLYFESHSDTEYCLDGYDRHDVHVIAQGGIDAGFTEHLCMFPGGGQLIHDIALPWHARRVDLTAYGGAQVRVAFEFSTLDGFFNNTLGWLVDDVRIVAEPGSPICPTAHAFSTCPCSYSLGWGGGCAQSSGASATLMSGGVASVASDSLTFTAAHMPPGTTALLFQGTTSSAAGSSFGDGLLCLGGALARLGTTSVLTGTQTWPLVGAPPLSVTGVVPLTGGNRYYQAFFRDSATFCTTANFNLTSAESVAWAP